MHQLALILMIAPPILLALTFHEFSHAYIAYRLGDSTAKDMGRLTLNPLAHLDLVGTIMVFIIRIGWAKPVPVNPLNFKNPKKDLLWVSLAGPLSNMLLAYIFGLLCRILHITDLTITNFSMMELIKFMVAYGMLINLILAFFNIIPIPPLDGSKILAAFLPSKGVEPFMKYGQFLLLGLIALSMVLDIPIFYKLYNPFLRLFSYLFAGVIFD